MLHIFCPSLFIQILIFLNSQFLVTANPIIGENVKSAEDNEFPFVVSLAFTPAKHPGNHFCTGALITKKHVLTAAHCFLMNEKNINYMIPSKIIVTVGSIDLTQGIKHNIKSWITFEEWALEKDVVIYNDVDLHDIAIVTLKNEVKNIEPALLSNLTHKHLYCKEVIAAGWGIIDGDVIPRYLRKAKLQVLNKKKCLRNLKANNWNLYDATNHLCTVATPPISLGCGDSGGPIFINGNEIVGVNEYSCASHNDPNQQNMHTSVRFYRKFIRSVTGL